MELIHAFQIWFNAQNWFLDIPAFLGYLNVIVAGAKVMGWMQLADFCGKLEDAITAMVQAALNKKNGGSNVQSNSPVLPESVQESGTPKI